MNVCVYLLFALTLISPAVFAEPLATVSNDVLATEIIYGTQPLILDVRTPEEYAAGHLPGAINIPHDQVAERYQELNQSETSKMVVYCRSGARAAIAQQVLLDLGFSNITMLEGHWLGWSDASVGLAVESSD